MSEDIALYNTSNVKVNILHFDDMPKDHLPTMRVLPLQPADVVIQLDKICPYGTKDIIFRYKDQEVKIPCEKVFEIIKKFMD